jgi:hypothetical protein
MADIDLLLVSLFNTAQRYAVPPVMKRQLSLRDERFTQAQPGIENVTGFIESSLILHTFLDSYKPPKDIR